MNNELVINIGSKRCKVFMQDGFLSPAEQKSPFHKHSYAEIHIVANKTTTFQIGNSIHSSEDGNLIIVPKDVFHVTLNEDTDSFHIAFQVNCELSEFKAVKTNPQTVIEFYNEIEKSHKTFDYTCVCAYMSLFISQLLPENLKAHPVTDYRFLIREFFSKHYTEDLHLSDLAKELHLSERQAERLVIKHTGNTFQKELISIRMSVANYLLDTAQMSLTQVAHYVGYRSYTGFWKAMRKYNEQNIPFTTVHHF